MTVISASSLRLGLDTIGTDDAAIQYLGVVSPVRVDWKRGAEIHFLLEWNKQANASYLTAGICLCPFRTQGSPESEPAWLKFEYIGVPPGQNLRSATTWRWNGQSQDLDVEGWPERNREGRPIGVQRVRLTIDLNRLSIYENGRVLVDRQGLRLPFHSAYLYLMMSSHSNYRTREVFFRDVEIKQGCR